MLRLTAVLAVLFPSVAGATRLAVCNSGKTGQLQLDITADGHGGYVLASKDDAEASDARVVRGTVTSATHQKLDKRHHVYRFNIADGSIQQAAGLDPKNCQLDGKVEHCALDSIEIRLARGGPTEPGDDGLSVHRGAVEVLLDNGGPQNCTVFASKALTRLLKPAPRS